MPIVTRHFALSASTALALVSCALSTPAQAQDASPAVSGPAVSGPAVSGLNGKIEALRGDLDGDMLSAAAVSLSFPLTHSLGVQIDGLLADYSATPTRGAGGHLFWRDPNLGLIGATGSSADINGTVINRFGLEGEAYLGPITLAGAGGWQNGESRKTGWGSLDLRWYPIANLALEIGAGAMSGNRTGHLGFEWQPLNEIAPGFALFADGAIGTKDYDHALGGVRLYFGASKTLKARHREDDPLNLMVNGVAGAVNGTASSRNSPSATRRAGSVSSGGGGPGGGPGSCFIGGTRVLMADGSEKAIEEVRLGDQLLGAEGSIKEVLNYDHPLLGSWALYAINGGSHFVTAEHPFMTKAGWKSIDPAASELEIPGLVTASLARGDQIISSRGTVQVISLESMSAAAETQLYNFRLSGNHTYFVRPPGSDGLFLLVHNK
jgi:hypothetical protein